MQIGKSYRKRMMVSDSQVHEIRDVLWDMLSVPSKGFCQYLHIVRNVPRERGVRGAVGLETNPDVSAWPKKCAGISLFSALYLIGSITFHWPGVCRSPPLKTLSVHHTERHSLS